MALSPARTALLLALLGFALLSVGDAVVKTSIAGHGNVKKQ